MPVVATRVGGIREIIHDKRTGLLVNPGNAAELARAIDLLLSDPKRAAEFGVAGYHDVRNRFGLERHVAAHLDFYREAQAILASRGRGPPPSLR